MFIPIFYISVLFAILYGSIFCYRPPSTIKTVVKVAATGLLTLWAYWLDGPWLLVAGLAFGTVGDAFLSGDPKKWLLPGLIAFFAGHIAYLTLFTLAPHSTLGLVNGPIAGLIFVLAVIYIRFLWNDLGDMRWPVVAYAGIIASMGAMTTLLNIGNSWVTFGAVMFIISDVLVSLELFKIEENSNKRYLTSPLLWTLYYGGQAMIAYGFLLKLE